MFSFFCEKVIAINTKAFHIGLVPAFTVSQLFPPKALDLYGQPAALFGLVLSVCLISVMQIPCCFLKPTIQEGC